MNSKKPDKEEEMVVIDLPKVLDLLKDSMLSQSEKIACHSCNKSYCCENQQRIEISTEEFKQIAPQITKRQLERAKEELDNPRHMYGKSVYSCSFLSDDDYGNKKCEIYENRFVVCASHGVVAPTEEACNTEVSKDGTFIVNPLKTFNKAMNEDESVLHYLSYQSTFEPSDILDEFKRLMNGIQKKDI